MRKFTDADLTLLPLMDEPVEDRMGPLELAEQIRLLVELENSRDFGQLQQYRRGSFFAGFRLVGDVQLEWRGVATTDYLVERE